MSGHAQAIAKALARRHHLLAEQAGFDAGIGINFEEVVDLAAFHGELLLFDEEGTTEMSFGHENQICRLGARLSDCNTCRAAVLDEPVHDIVEVRAAIEIVFTVY